MDGREQEPPHYDKGQTLQRKGHNAPWSGQREICSVDLQSVVDGYLAETRFRYSLWLGHSSSAQ